MALTQIQIIQSLGEAMNWLERELSWGVAVAEQRHLGGRIGELYAALMTSGQMAPETNQPGYDVVSSSGERISVKTTTQDGAGGHMSFNSNTLDQVDRIMVFFLNTEEMQIDTLLDSPVADAKKLFVAVTSQGKFNLSLSKLRKSIDPVPPLDKQKVVAEVSYKGVIIREFESGSILVVTDAGIEPITKPHLQKISSEIGLPIINSNGNLMNTRQLGTRLIKQLQAEI